MNKADISARCCAMKLEVGIWRRVVGPVVKIVVGWSRDEPAEAVNRASG
jgi:hypothetical protein